MALFADGPAPTIDDLTNEDSGLLDVAQNCGINVTTKLQLAHGEIAAQLQLWLNRPRPILEFGWGMIWQVEQVVVTAALKRWETMQALALVYRDAYFSQLVDRYQAKWDEYSRLTRSAYETFVATGMGMVKKPVSQAAPPLLGQVAGPQKGGTFYAAVAWLNADGQEGASSAASSISIPDGQLMTVTASGAPPNAIGFNVYAGVSLDAMGLQTDVPLPAGGSFIYVPGFVTGGRLPSGGQQPDLTRALTRTSLRG